MVGCLRTINCMFEPVVGVPVFTAMITRAPTLDDVRLALACVNKRPERTAGSPERWVIHRPDGSFAFYLVTWEGASVAHSQLSLRRIPEPAVPVITALILPQPANTASVVRHAE